MRRPRRKRQVIREKGYSLWTDGRSYWVNYAVEFESWDLDEDGKLVQVRGLDGTPEVDRCHISKLMGFDEKTAIRQFRKWLTTREGS